MAIPINHYLDSSSGGIQRETGAHRENLWEKCHEQLSGRILHQIPEAIFEGIPAWVPEEMPSGISKRIPDGFSCKIPALIPGGNPTGTSERTSRRGILDSPWRGMPGEIPERIPVVPFENLSSYFDATLYLNPLPNTLLSTLPHTLNIYSTLYSYPTLYPIVYLTFYCTLCPSPSPYPLYYSPSYRLP